MGSSPDAPWHRAPIPRLLPVPFPAAPSQQQGDAVPTPSQAICPAPVRIPWASQRMSALQTERLSPSPPFSGEGACSCSHSEAASLAALLCRRHPSPGLCRQSHPPWNNGTAASARKRLCPSPLPISARHPWQAAQPKPTARPGQRRMESGPSDHGLAGWLSGEELNLCHQHTSMLTKSILQ